MSAEPDPANILKESDAGPTLVARAFEAPGKCLVTGDIDGPFVETNAEFDGTRVYIHAPWITQVARDLLGMVESSVVDELEAQIAEIEQERDALSMAFDALGKAAA